MALQVMSTIMMTKAMMPFSIINYNLGLFYDFYLNKLTDTLKMQQ